MKPKKEDSRPAGSISITELPDRSGPYLLNIPEDIICSAIFSFLNPKSLCLVASSCKILYKLGEKVFKERCAEQSIEKGELNSYKEAFLKIFTGYSGLYHLAGNKLSYSCAILQNAKKIDTGTIIWCADGNWSSSKSVEVFFGTFILSSIEIHMKDVKSVLKLHYNYRNYIWRNYESGNRKEEQGKVDLDFAIDLSFGKLPNNPSTPYWSHSFPDGTREDRVVMSKKLSLPEIASLEKLFETKEESPWGVSDKLKKLDKTN